MAVTPERPGDRERRRATIALLLGVPVLVTVVLLVAGALERGDEPADATSRDVRTIAVRSREHVEGDVAYPQTPPAGGDHAPVWQNCGYYADAVPSEQAVHSLEHGAVWITYDPQLDETARAALAELADRYTFVLISPFGGLPAPVVASAWGRQLLLDGVDDPSLDEFVVAFRQGPQTPEPGAPCTNGIGVSQ